MTKIEKYIYDVEKMGIKEIIENIDNIEIVGMCDEGINYTEDYFNIIIYIYGVEIVMMGFANNKVKFIKKDEIFEYHRIFGDRIYNNKEIIYFINRPNVKQREIISFYIENFDV